MYLGCSSRWRQANWLADHQSICYLRRHHTPQLWEFLYHDKTSTNHGEELTKHSPCMPCKGKQSREAVNTRLRQRKENPDFDWSLMHCDSNAFPGEFSKHKHLSLTTPAAGKKCLQTSLCVQVHTQSYHRNNCNVVFSSIHYSQFAKTKIHKYCII